MTQELNKVMGMVCERERQYYNAKKVDAVLAEKEAAIAELKNEINRKEGVGQRWFERCMEARTENVRLKRALWLARAECAKWKSCYYWYAVSRKHDSRMYDEVERKCRAKAEKYK